MSKSIEMIHLKRAKKKKIEMIHSLFTQQIFIEHLLFARHCSWSWRLESEQERDISRTMELTF